MKRYIKAATKFSSPEGLIHVGPVSDHETWVHPGYDHQIDNYTDEFKDTVIEIVNKMQKERNKKGLNLRNYTNDAEEIIRHLINPHSPYSFPDLVLEYSDIFDGEYYIDYTNLYRLIDNAGGLSNHVKNYKKLIKSSPYYISEDRDGQLNLIPNQVVLDMIYANPNTEEGADISIHYVDHNIEYLNDMTNESFTFYPVDKSSAEKMQKVIDTLTWNQDITDYLLSQAGTLWSD